MTRLEALESRPRKRVTIDPASEKKLEEVCREFSRILDIKHAGGDIKNNAERIRMLARTDEVMTDVGPMTVGRFVEILERVEETF